MGGAKIQAGASRVTNGRLDEAGKDVPYKQEKLCRQDPTNLLTRQPSPLNLTTYSQPYSSEARRRC